MAGAGDQERRSGYARNGPFRRRFLGPDVSPSARQQELEIDGLVSESVALLRAIGSFVMERLADAVAERVAQRTATTSPWMTTEEAAQYSKIARGTFEKLASGGHWRRHYHARRFVYHRDELDEDLKAGPGSRPPTRARPAPPSGPRQSRAPRRS
jgi:hypothetical protein